MGLDDSTVKMWETGTGHLATTFTLERQASITAVVYADSIHKIFCVASNLTLQSWDIQTKRNLSVPLELGDRLLKLNGSEIAVFSGDRVRLFDAGTLLEKSRLPLRKTPLPALIRDIFETKDRWLVAWSDSIMIYDRKFRLIKKFPAAIDDARSLNTHLVAFDDLGGRIVLWDQARKNLAVLDMNNGLPIWKKHLENSLTVSVCGNGRLLVDLSASPPLLLDLASGNAVDVKPYLPNGIGLYRYFSNRQWLVCAENRNIYQTKEHSRVYTFIDALTLKTCYRDTVPAESLDTYAFALGSKHFAFSVGKINNLAAVSVYPRIYDLKVFNLTDILPVQLNTLADVYSKQLADPVIGVKNRLQSITLKNFNQQNVSGVAVFSRNYHYAFLNYFTRKKELRRVDRLSPDSLAVIIIKDFGWKNDHADLAAFSPDEHYFIIGKDSTLTIVRTETGNPITQRHLAYFLSGTPLYSDNHNLILSDRNSNLDYYNYVSKRWVTLKVPEAVTALSCIDSMTYIGCGRNNIYRIELRTGSVTPLVGNHRILEMLTVAEKHLVYTLLDDGSVRVIDLANQRVVTMADGKKHEDLSINYNEMGIGATVFEHLLLSGDQRYLLTHTRDAAINIWDLQERRLLFSTKMNKVNQLILDGPKGLLIAFAQPPYAITPGEQLRVYDFKENRLIFSDSLEIMKIKAQPPASVASALSLPLTVYENGKENKAHILDMRHLSVDGSNSHIWLTAGRLTGVLNLNSAQPMRWSVYEKPLDISGFADTLALIKSFKELSLQGPAMGRPAIIPLGEQDYISKAGSFPGYIYAITEHHEPSYKSFYNFTLYSQKENRVVITHRITEQVADISASPDHHYVASSTGTNSRPDSAFLFEAATGRFLASVAGSFLKTFFSGDSKYWVCCFDKGEAGVFNIEQGKMEKIPINVFHTSPLPDGHYIRCGSDLVDLSDLHVYKTNLSGIGQIFQQQVYGIAQTGEAGVYSLTSNTFQNIAYQQSGGFTSAVVSPDRRYLLTLGYDIWLSKWNLQTGLLESQVQVPYNPGRSLYFNSDSTLVLIVDPYNGMAFRTKGLQLMYTFAPAQNGSLNYFLSDGFYFTNKEELGNYYFSYKGNLWGYRQFDAHFNRPDLVLKAVGLDQPELLNLYHNAFLKRSSNLGIDPNFDLTAAEVPTLTLLNEAALGPKQTADSLLTLDIRVTVPSIPLAKLKVTVNGNPVAARQLAKNNRRTQDQQVPVKLAYGPNKIDMSCFDSKGTESLIKTITVKYLPPSKPRSKTYFIGIGLNNYEDKRQHLNFSVRDIGNFDSLLRVSVPGLISYTLTDQQVTEKAIDSLLNKLADAGINDKVVLFYSGHGLRNGLDFYLSTYRSDFGHPGNGAYEFRRLEQGMAKISARQKLVLIDACNSGGADVDRQTDTDPYRALAKPLGQADGYARSFDLMQDIFADANSSSGAVIICASRSTQFANEGKNNGVFTKCLIDGISSKKADLNQDGVLTVEELKQYVGRQVPLITKGHQQPVARADIPGLDWALVNLP